MKVGVVMPIGPVDGTGVVPPWEATRVAALATERGGLRLRLGLRPPALPLRDRSHRRHPRVLDRPVRHGRHHLAGRAGHPGAGHALPEPGTAGQDGGHLRGRFGWQADPGRGCGWNEPEFTAFDFPFDHRVGRFEEALSVLVPALREGRASFAGRWHSASDLEILPRYARPDGRPTPLLIAGRGAADAAAGRAPRRCLEYGLDRLPRPSCRRGW